MTNTFDEKERAQEELVALIQAFEKAASFRRAALVLYQLHPATSTRETYQEKLTLETDAGAKLNKALKRMNNLEGKTRYAERNIMDAKWRPSRGNLPHRF